MARTARKRTVKKLDDITRKIIKLRDKDTCQRCMKRASGQGCHWAHIYGRRSYLLRWDLLNSLVLCAGCHRWWHENPLESDEWFKEKFPARYEWLQFQKKQPPRTIRTSELQSLYTKLQQKLTELNETS